MDRKAPRGEGGRYGRKQLRAKGFKDAGPPGSRRGPKDPPRSLCGECSSVHTLTLNSGLQNYERTRFGGFKSPRCAWSPKSQTTPTPTSQSLSRGRPGLPGLAWCPPARHGFFQCCSEMHEAPALGLMATSAARTDRRTCGGACGLAL